MPSSRSTKLTRRDPKQDPERVQLEMVPWWTQTQSRQKLHLIISGEKRTLQSVDNNINKKNGNKNQKTQKQTNRQFEMQQIIVLSFSARLLCETDKHLGRQVCRQVDRQARTNGQHNRGRETKDWIDLKKLQQPQHNTTTTTPRINSQTHEHKTQDTIYTQGPAASSSQQSHRNGQRFGYCYYY